MPQGVDIFIDRTAKRLYMRIIFTEGVFVAMYTELLFVTDVVVMMVFVDLDGSIAHITRFVYNHHRRAIVLRQLTTVINLNVVNYRLRR